MTQEEKSLLIKDLSARLPYRVVMNVTEPGDDRVNFNCFLSPDIIKEITSEIGHFKYKPYLRPMSNMTEEEQVSLKLILPFGVKVTDVDFAEVSVADTTTIIEYIDWLNRHHFDYRNLIEKKLALEALNNMYK